MDILSFEPSRSDVPTIDLFINGQMVSDFVGVEPPHDGIPVEYFTGSDLPSKTWDGLVLNHDAGERLVGVCSCGVAGCGSTTATFLREAAAVRMILPVPRREGGTRVWHDLRFTFSRDQFDTTLREIWEYVQRGEYVQHRRTGDLKPKQWP